MWKILICDDEYDWLENLEKNIMKLAGDKVSEIKLFTRREQIEFYVSDHPEESNIIILDIKLDDGNGIKLAEMILKEQPNSQIIFMSAFDGHYLDAYDVEHVYFLKKPIELHHLENALKRAGENLLDLNNNYFIVNNKQGIYKIPLNEILYFESKKRKIHIFTYDRELSYYGKFDTLMQQLDKRFMRCHNSYIVNINKVMELNDKKFKFRDDRAVPISRTYYSDVKDEFIRYLIEED